jgi:2-amino-4-hydroxy-6-hydroxymethyldihydropteridine diphosphokinase
MDRHSKIAYLSLGSNLGDRAAQIRQALERLAAAGVKARRRSRLYETEPVGTSAQRWFVNCVVEVGTELMPLALLRTLKRIERTFGRATTAGPNPSARRIDIDILLYGEHVVRLPELTIPHPRLAERRFVLEPLRELAPEWRHPLTRQTAAEMLAQLQDRAAVRRLRGESAQFPV